MVYNPLMIQGSTNTSCIVYNSFVSHQVGKYDAKEEFQMKIEFTVRDIPPKKDGANSMWSKNSEAPRIISLRKAALDAMKKAGLNGCILSPVKLEVTVFAQSSQFIRNSGNYMGDLD